MKIHNINHWIAASCMMIVVTACGNDSEPTEETVSYLKVNLEGVALSSRAIIEGSTLPDNVSYGIFAMNGYTEQCIDKGENVEVFYKDQVSETAVKIPLPQDVHVPVYAYYPYSEDVSLASFPIDISTQTDYLWGYGVDQFGKQWYATATNRSIGIYLKHILSRITLRIHRDADNDINYKLSSVLLSGDGMNTYRTCMADVQNQTLRDLSYGGYSDVKGSMQGYYLESSDDVVTVDYLIIPSGNVEWSFFITGSTEFWSELPVTDYVSGEQYTFDVTIMKGQYLSVSAAEISQWENHDQSEVTLK